MKHKTTKKTSQNHLEYKKAALTVIKKLRYTIHLNGTTCKVRINYFFLPNKNI